MAAGGSARADVTHRETLCSATARNTRRNDGMPKRKESAGQQSAGDARSSSLQVMQRKFREPSAEYGPVDCWWWEAARLSEERMRFQLEDMQRKGISGTWFYPRLVRGEPLQSTPPYWSDEWWDFTAFSLDEHARLGLRAWFSDWTGLEAFQNQVRAEREERPELTGRRLAIREQASAGAGPVTIEIPPEEEILDAAAYRSTDAGLDYASRRDLRETVADNRVTWSAPDEGWTVIAIAAQPHDLDYSNRCVVDRWLELLLGTYEARLPGHVGGALQAYGPDEMFVLRGSAFYSASLLERFRATKGYDPLPWLAGMFRDIGPKTDKIRCDYYEVMIDLLDENFYKPIADWLHERGMLYTTIATWGRKSPIDQTHHYGDFFRMMRHFDVTGNEDPGLHEVGGRCFIDAKFSSSIAHLYERERVAVCAYWGSGWGVTQEQNLAWTNENYAYGMNLYNRHGGLYSTLGGWFEWVPPAIHFRQPYWQYWKHFTDYVRRLSYLMSQGNHVADVALLYPLTTMHAGWATGNEFSDAAREVGQKIMDLAGVIYRHGIDFDFIDDFSLCRAEVSGGTLNVSGLSFQAVVLPPLTTIRTDTLNQLREFHAAGGTVIAFGRLPDASPECGRDDPHVCAVIKEMFGAAPGEAPRSVETNGAEGQALFVLDDESQVPALLSDAIARDVVVAEGDVFHTHQRTDDADLYLLFNVKPKRRRVSVSLRSRGEPEIWEAFTGQVSQVHRFQSRQDVTTVVLDLDPWQAVVLVLRPSEARPHAIDGSLDQLLSLTPCGRSVEVEGLCESGGVKDVRLAHEGTEYIGQAQVEAPPEPIPLDGMWAVRLEPTMDNRWGDSRHPPSDEIIGPEARRFRYHEEGPQPGKSLGWHEAGFDDTDWLRTTYTYGPYLWALGPLDEDHDPRDILGRTTPDGPDTERVFDATGGPARWEPFSFSMRYGNEEPDPAWGGLLGVPQDYLVLEAVPGGRDVVRYLLAHVLAPGAGEWTLDLGGEVELPRQAWVNGEEVISTSAEKSEARAEVRLKDGWNSILLRIVQSEGEVARAYAALLDPSSPPVVDPYVPLLRWFQGPQRLLFDVTPKKENRVGWYRFASPPGVRSMRLKLNARSVEVWADGRLVTNEPVQCPEHPSDGSEIDIPLPDPPAQSSRIALRIEQKSGCYSGAAFAEPAAFECGTGRMPLGDWCDFGLETYSGGVVYSRALDLDKAHLANQIYLDLGNAVTVAEVLVNGRSAGVKMARPFRFDITDLAAEGSNELEVKVVNTLANHMSSYPTGYIHPGQTVSGLLGPAELRFARKVQITASRDERTGSTGYQGD